MSFLFGKSFMLHKHMLFWSPQVMKGGNSTLVKKMCKRKDPAQLVPPFHIQSWKSGRGSAWGCRRARDVHSRGKHRQKLSLLCPFWLPSCQTLSTSNPSWSQDSSQLAFSNSWKYTDPPPELQILPWIILLYRCVKTSSHSCDQCWAKINSVVPSPATSSSNTKH